jgi:hypothetical protein
MHTHTHPQPARYKHTHTHTRWHPGLRVAPRVKEIRGRRWGGARGWGVLVPDAAAAAGGWAMLTQRQRHGHLSRWRRGVRRR